MLVNRIASLTQFERMYSDLRQALLVSESVDVGEWQSQNVKGDANRVTMEIQHAILQMPVEGGLGWLKPNLSWAEDHFQERISGQPLNPPPSEAWWPYAVQGNAEHKEGAQFSHTYPERYWPKFANAGNKKPNGRETAVPHNGIRYEYGDLGDVIDQLRSNKLTRQAYLPVWFPEDTGAVHGERVPCSLGYHFLYRQNKLHISYFIRSCDFIRHFRDDIYMTMRLCQWMAACLGGVPTGDLIMYIGSLHAFEADRYGMEQATIADMKSYDDRLMGILG